MNTSTYTVTGMTCGHCVGAVTQELSGLPGVTDVTIDLVPEGLSTVTVSSAGPLAEDAVRAAVDISDAPSVVRFPKGSVADPVVAVRTSGTVDVLAEPDDAAIALLLRDHLLDHYAFHGEERGVLSARKHVGWYLAQRAGARECTNMRRVGTDVARRQAGHE